MAFSNPLPVSGRHERSGPPWKLASMGYTRPPAYDVSPFKFIASLVRASLPSSLLLPHKCAFRSFYFVQTADYHHIHEAVYLSVFFHLRVSACTFVNPVSCNSVATSCVDRVGWQLAWTMILPTSMVVGRRWWWWWWVARYEMGCHPIVYTLLSTPTFPG